MEEDVGGAAITGSHGVGLISSPCHSVDYVSVVQIPVAVVKMIPADFGSVFCPAVAQH